MPHRVMHHNPCGERGWQWRPGFGWRAGLPRVGLRSGPTKNAASCQANRGASFRAASQPNAGQARSPPKARSPQQASSHIFECIHISIVGAGLPAIAVVQAPDFPGIIHTNPLAFARSWHNANTTRRSALSMRLQRVISSTLRWQPVQISSSSSAQILTQGEATGRSIGFILLAQPSPGHSAARYAHSAQRWLRACAFAPRSTHAPLCPATPLPASHREFPCLRRSTNWRR